MNKKELVPGRECGECTLCCIKPTIDCPELKKLSGVRCENLAKTGGCSIYDKRPQTCRDFSLPFNPEGRQFLAHGERTMEAEELHQIHPDGTYIFNYKTKSGEMKGQPLSIQKRETTDIMPEPATLTLSQDNLMISSNEINPDKDLKISWTQMKGNMKSDTSELADLIFVLAFDCFGNNIAHSGRPYNGKPFLTYIDKSYTIPAASLNPGISYNLIVEQATADVNRYQGVPGIATYATLTFLDGTATGTALQNNSCPVS